MFLDLADIISCFVEDQRIFELDAPVDCGKEKVCK